MRDFKVRRGRFQKIFLLFLLLLAIVGLSVVAGVSLRAAWNMYDKLLLASETSAATQAQLAALRTQHSEVKEALGELSSPRGVEAQVRERFGVARPGEGQITIVRQESPAGVGGARTQNLLERLWDALFVW
jgi:cell division protein FtsB